MKKREQFAVQLRKKNTLDILQAKRRRVEPIEEAKFGQAGRESEHVQAINDICPELQKISSDKKVE